MALGFLQRTGDRYANTPETDLFLDRKKPSYMGGILEMANRRLYGFWGNLTEALRTGEPQNEVKSGGLVMFDTLYADPARLKGFLAAMTGISHGANMTIARAFPWANYRTFVDVGTAQGDLAAQIALANPHLRGIGFDLPKVAPIFEEYVAALGVSDRLTFQSGDFFKQDFPKADVVLMGHILHDWDLATKKMLLKKAFDAVPAGGAVIVYEGIIDDDRSKNAFGLLMSLNMLIETPGGFDYTGADCSGWMKEAGFSCHACRAARRAGLDGDRNQVSDPRSTQWRASPLVAFYRGDGRDHRGRSLSDIHGFDFYELEFHSRLHSVAVSAARAEWRQCVGAPYCRKRTSPRFESDESLRKALLQSFELMLSFFGLDVGRCE